MAGEVFDLKYRDTIPVLQVQLLNPDGSVHDLTGSTSWKAHIWLSNGSKLIRDMVKVGADVDGTLKYTWLDTDWDAASGGDPAPIGGLVVSPGVVSPNGYVLRVGQREHWIEYEVIGGSSRLTFPSNGFDILRIRTDVGNG